MSQSSSFYMLRNQFIKMWTGLDSVWLVILFSLLQSFEAILTKTLKVYLPLT